MKRAALGLLSVILVTSAQQGARLLIISYDSYAPQLQAFADWKSKSGLLARVVPLSQVGRTQDSIRNYVLNAYNTWNPRPEFLLLVGANTQIPAYSYFTDNYFGDMTGDFRAELDVGRWPCRNARQCSVMVSKSLNYERYPSLTDSTWFKKGTFIVREDPGPDDSIYWSDARTSCSAMRASGFSEIDTFSYLQGHNASDVVSAVNSGRSFIAYRGVATVNWYTPFAVNPSLTTNGFQLPIILSATCMTVSLVPNESMISDGWLRAGTVNAPKGAVAFFGNTHAASHVAPVRSAICRGFVQAYFRDSVPFLGQACRAGREQMYSEFGNSTEYQGFTLEGDPTLRYWTAKPVTATVTYDSVIPVGSSNFTVQVTRSGVPVRNALVCVRKGTEVYTWGLTNSSGQVVLAVAPASTGSMDVTVTGRNLIPHEGTTRIVSGVADVAAISILTPTGSVDSGSTLVPRAVVRNLGNQGATFWTCLKVGTCYLDSSQVSNLGAGRFDTIEFRPWTALLRGSSIVLCTVALSGDVTPGNNLVRDSVWIKVHDVGVSRIIVPGDTVTIGDTIMPQLLIRNFGNAPETLMAFFVSRLQQDIDDYRDSIQVSLLAGDSAVVSFADWIPELAGWYDIYGFTILARDINPANDSLHREVLVFIQTDLAEAEPVFGASLLELEPVPNPVQGRAQFLLQVPAPSRIRLRVFDLSGRLQAELIDQQLRAGRHVVHWVPPRCGIYLVRVDNGRRVVTKKFTVS